MEELQGSPRRVRSSSISSMSQLLLQGWAMLADCCPYCGVPLMRSPDGSQLLCTNCGCDTTAGAAAAGRPAPAEAPAAMPQQPTQANGTGDHADSSRDEEASEGLLQPPPPLRTRLQAAAATEAAPAQQLAQSAASALQQLPVPAPGLAGRPTAAARSERRSSGGQEASKAIAELMLEGWAMLQEHCPRCLNPLLRSRDRQRIYCAGCRLDAVHEGEQPGAVPGAPAGAAVAPAGGSAGGSAPTRLPAAAGTGAIAAPGTPAAPLQQHAAAVEAAAAAVAARLSAATEDLRSAAAERAAQLLGEVRLCAAALQSLAEAHIALTTPPASG